MNHRPHRHHHPVRLLAAGSSLALVACASGQSILQAGNDGTTTTAATTTAATGGTLAPPTTICIVTPCPSAAAPAAPAAPTTIRIAPSTPGSAAGPGGFAAAPGATVNVAGNPDYAQCPVDALDEADGPVRIVFWHGMVTAQEDALIELTEQYNASQDRVVVELQNQNGYEELIDKYFQSSNDDRPHLVQMPEYMTQQMADANTVVSSTACIQASGYDITPFLPRSMLAYQTGGVQWSMPFNISNPVLYYNRVLFEEAGLDPDDPPITLEEWRAAAEAIVDSGAATYGIALDSGVNSGGGWFLEQWLARAGLPYADNDNGRTARATQVLFDTPESVEMLTYAQGLVDDGLAVYVGENASGADILLQLADPETPAAMGISSSGALGTVLNAVDGGLIPDVTTEDIGVGPMPGPSDTPSALVGGASLYIVRDKGDAETTAAWDYIQFLVGAEQQSFWSDATGYTPVREDAIEIDPLATRFADDPRFRVAFDQVVFAADDFTALGPVLGPMRQVRDATASMMADIYGGASVEEALTFAADQANLLIIDYNNRN